MKRDSSSVSAHLSGEQSLVVATEVTGSVDLDSFFGPVRVEWDHEAALTPLGQLPFFIHFLKASGLFDALVADCPLRYRSPNAPNRREVLGTAMLSMLAGHRRYAHIAALRCDAVLPELLGMKKIVCLSGCHPCPLNVGCTHSPEYSPSKVGASAPPAIPSSERNALNG
jgi:hypothetical protein